MKKKFMKVTVTQAHIRSGRVNSLTCPIALALRDRFPGNYVKVSYQHGRSYVGDFYFSVTPAMRAFMTKFDEGEKVSPHTFWISRPPESKVRHG